MKSGASTWSLKRAEDALIAYQEESGATLLSENGLALVDQITGLDLERARLSMNIGAHREVMRQLELDEVPRRIDCRQHSSQPARRIAVS